MCALYKLIALVALALTCRAQLTPEECQPLTKLLSAADMHKIYGHWTLAAAFADFEAGFEMIANISTSHLDLSLNNDKNTIHYLEMNKDLNGVCVSRSSDATVVNGVSTALTLHLGEFVKEQGGVQSNYNADADVVFYQTCPNCLVRIYKATYSGQEARVLFFYRRNGRHMEVEKLRAYEESMKKQAKCLKFLPDPHYMHDGKPETTSCRAQLTPEQCAPLTKTLPASEIHRIYGHWVLAGAFADFQEGLEMIGKISTSYLDLSLSLNNDKPTIHYHEMNKDLNGKCVSRSSDATVVDGGSTALTLRVGEFVKEEDGVQSKYNADADVVFYQTCPNCLVRIYKATYSGREAQVLFFYRREGKHLEVEKLTAYEESMRKQAECLKFLPDSNYMYDGKPVTTSCTAEFTPEQCEPLTKSLPASDSEKYKIYGHWMLAAAFADFEAGLEMIGNISTSHLELSLNNDKNTIHYIEMNKDLNGKCVSRSSDATVVNGESTALTLRVGEFVKEEDGVQSKYNADADVVFYQTCPNCLVRIYKATYSGQEAQVLFFYRREEKHLEVEKLIASEEHMKKRAKCLKFFVDPHYMYDGKSESCRAQLTPEQCAPLTKTLPASEIHRIYGHWVLAGAFANFQAGLEMIGKISTSYLHLSMNNDKNTIQYIEMNKDINGKCVSRSSDATVVNGESTALTLRVGEFVKEEDGVQSKYNADADVVFYQTCPNCLVRIYKATYSGQEAQVIFFYRREGKHLELEKLIAYEESMKKQATCLEFLPDSNYMYDGKPVTTSCRAEFTPEQCEPLTKPLPASEKYKIYGHWVLAAAFADFEAGLEMIRSISTSRLDLSLNNDKNTIHYNEMNKDLNGKCVSRSSDATVVDRGSTALTLRVGEFVKEQDGVQSKYNADADVVFYQTCPNCLVRIYKATYSGQEARVLFFYRREGHLEVEKLIASEEYIKKQAKCLKFLVDPHYMYDGKPETTSCRAQLTPEQCAPLTKTLPASEIHRIYGHWVLAGAFADFQAGLRMIGKISTSYLHLSSNNDKNTIQYLEMNKDLNGKCVSRSSDATVVNGESTALTLRVGEFVKEEDGVQSKYIADADVVFYQTCPNCLVRIYKATYSGREAQVLFFYRREGKHLEVEKLIAYEESMRKQAECLKFLPDSNYMYDGKPVTTSCRAEFTPEQCEPLTKPLPASEKYKIYGHWVLAAAFADFEAGLKMIGSISTSHLDLSLNDDKNSIHYIEMNKDLRNVCVGRSSNATVVNGETTACTLHVGEFMKEEDGVESKYIADADVVFYQTCPNCLVRIYRATYSGQEARVLFFYRREGKHLEVEKLIASKEYMKKQAKCLKFLPDPHYMYDGKPETTSCRAQLTPEQCEPLTKTLPVSEMQKIYGTWVLAAAFVDFEAGFEMIAKISTSRLDLSLNDDKRTIRYHEMNKDLNNVCVGRYSDATVVNGDTTACTLHVGEFIKEQDAVQSKYNADADVVFYQTCPNCLVRIYKANHSGQEARILFFYRREGEHLEVEKLLASEEYMQKQAKCLKFFDEPHYMYDGKSEVCKQKA